MRSQNADTPPPSLDTLESAEEKKIFWIILAVLLIATLVSNYHLFIRIKPKIDIPGLLMVISLNFISFYFIKNIYHKFQTSMKWKNIMFLLICFATICVEYFFHGIIYLVVMSRVDWGDVIDSLMFMAPYEISILFASGALYASLLENLRVRQQAIALERANTLAQSAQLNMLRYQLNPHFLFNTLNSLSALILRKRSEEAEGIVLGLSRFLRYTLDNDDRQLVFLEEDIEAQRTYLEIEKIRFQERLNLQVKVHPGLARALVPSLMLQPIVENIVKHVVAISNDTCTISISANADDEKLVINVEDDGPGVANPEILLEKKRNGVGLRNIAERLALLYGDAAQLNVTNRETDGLCVTITLPMQFESKDDENPIG